MVVTWASVCGITDRHRFLDCFVAFDLESMFHMRRLLYGNYFGDMIGFP